MGYLIAAYLLGVGGPLLYGIHLARERRALRSALASTRQREAG